jgi:serine/threonine protein kinase
MALPDPWELVRELPPGGQAFLFVVKRRGEAQTYVLKSLKNPGRAGRFEREIELTASLHAELPWAFPEIMDSGRGNNDRPFYVMPWFPGSLQAEVDDQRYLADPRRALSRQIELVDVLALLHAKGWAHRDLKPANVLVNMDDELVLADLGLAIDLLDPDALRETETDEAVGSRLYLAPEHEDGRYEGNDHRPSDFYAFGKIMWVLLTGRRPLAREGQLEPANRIATVLEDERLAALDTLGALLLELDPARRLTTWGPVRTELVAVAGRVDEPPMPQSTSTPIAGAVAAVSAFNASALAHEIAGRADYELTRGQRYQVLVDAAFERSSNMAPLAAEVNVPGSRFQVVSGSRSNPAFGQVLPALRQHWPRDELTLLFSDACIGRGSALNVGIDCLFRPTPPSAFVSGFVLLTDGDDVWMLTVPVFLEQRAGGGASVFVSLLDRFASLEGPYSLGLSSTLEAAVRLGDLVCDYGTTLFTEYVQHLIDGRDVRAAETWQPVSD